AALLRARQRASTRPVQRSITVDAPAEVLHARWRDPDLLTQIMQPLGTVTADPSGGGALRWRVVGPFGRTIEWVTRIVEDQPPRLIRWVTVDGAPIESGGSVEFRQDRPELGTTVTLRLRLGIAIPHLVPKMGIAKILRRFKSLVETGEVPTLEHNPSARASALAY
ncbi:MAG TPA: SRPBCC family protein, partial [Kofleriaceae bacterium]